MKLQLKKKLLIAAIVPAIGIPMAAPVFAQSDSAAQSSRQQGQQRQQQNIRDMRASELIGITVRDKQGKELGEVQDLIVDVGDQRADYAILAFGGVMGFGEKLFAYPMDRFQARGSGDDKELVLNVSEQELKDAPGFDRSNWPTFGMGGYRGEVDRHFGKTAKAGGNLIRMSELLGEDVVDTAGKDVGEIEDVVVSVSSGRVIFVALEPDDDLNLGNRLVMLPMQAIQATNTRQASGASDSSERAAGSGDQAEQAQRARDDAERQQVQQSSAEGQAERNSGASGTVGTTGAGRGEESKRAARQAGREQDGDLKLVLNMQPSQLQNARSFQEDQWPDLNSRSFQRDIDRYVASFPSSRSTSTGASGTEASDSAASSGRKESEAVRQQEQPSEKK